MHNHFLLNKNIKYKRSKPVQLKIFFNDVVSNTSSETFYLYVHFTLLTVRETNNRSAYKVLNPQSYYSRGHEIIVRRHVRSSNPIVICSILRYTRRSINLVQY